MEKKFQIKEEQTQCRVTEYRLKRQVSELELEKNEAPSVKFRIREHTKISVSEKNKVSQISVDNKVPNIDIKKVSLKCRDIALVSKEE